MDEMLAGMPMSEYIHWQAIYETEPFPEERADRRAAQQMVNIRRALGQTGTLELSEFIPDWWGDLGPQQQTPEQMQANLSLIKAAKVAAKKKKRKP